jgi:hypothetical protein
MRPTSALIKVGGPQIGGPDLGLEPLRLSKPPMPSRADETRGLQGPLECS